VRRVATALAVLGAFALLAAPAVAKKRHNHKPSGVDGVVLNSTCPGACAVPPPPQPVYTGAVTIKVQRVTDAQQVASQAITDGHFRIRLKRGLYDVSSVPPNPTPPPCGPAELCPLEGTPPHAIIEPCMTGETQRVQVRRHHFAHVELHVGNTCIV
jgi:hypothetical protein